MYGLSNSENIFDLRWPLKVKGQGQTPKNWGTLLFQSTIDIHIQYPHKKQWVVPCWLHWLLQCALCCYQTAKARTPAFINMYKKKIFIRVHESDLSNLIGHTWLAVSCGFIFEKSNNFVFDIFEMQILEKNCLNFFYWIFSSLFS